MSPSTFPRFWPHQLCLAVICLLGPLSNLPLPGLDYPTIPPVPSAKPLTGSPGDQAYHELREHIEYVYGVETKDLPDSVAIPDPAVEWKGLNRFEVLDLVRILAQAQVVVEHGVLDPADRGLPIWIRTIRGYKKANGWYGLLINGQPIDESIIWFQYGGDNLNLRTFCTTGSRMVNPGLQFQR